MATNFTQQLQQDYPKTWAAFREWYEKQDVSVILRFSALFRSGDKIDRYPLQQGVFEAFGRSRGYDIMIYPKDELGVKSYMGDSETDWYKEYHIDHPTAHQAAVTAMFAEIEKEENHEPTN